jgi:hypothetical protein
VSKIHRDLEVVLLRIFPELAQYRDRLHIIFAGPSSNFYDRNEMAVAHEIDQMAKNGRDLVFFYDLSELITSKAILKIHRILNYVKTNLSTFYYTTLTLEAKEIYKNICLAKNFNPRLEMVISNVYVNVVEHSVDPGEYEIAIKLKQFLCFNKNHRLHRIALLGKILGKNLLDKSFYSMYGAWHQQDWLEHSLASIDLVDLNLKSILNKHKNIFPLHLNANKHTRENPLEVSNEDLYYFKNSYYSLVTETLFYKDKIDPFSEIYEYGTAFTEKTYKTIAVKHPFIIVSTPNFLKELRNLGFKTFAPYIDESYDTEHNDRKRLNMIVDEVERLSQFTDEQWIEWQTNIKDIVEYNYTVYKNMTDVRITKDIQIPGAPIGF